MHYSGIFFNVATIVSTLLENLVYTCRIDPIMLEFEVESGEWDLVK